MQSAPLEWSLALAYPVIVDIVRNWGDPDGDTLSEVTRDVFRVHTPRGRLAFTATLAAGAVAFHRHICKEVTW